MPINLTDVRQKIDAIDKQMFGLMARRGEYVKLAAKFKTTEAEVAAPDRVAIVIEKVKKIATESGADVVVVEQVYRKMIAEFIELERRELKERH
ncbi:chorismate mutase [Pseudolactococcus plantarum]|uniref:Chorismate mutase n=1 Tax=Pseudolactococcus plantarum TaxID=1365 RepID=A0A2A5S111_9LACT|nr:chorismate mutase [Lactococcus plantarum]PCS07108.1 chorismate mutase [Lactococcus plantarum]HCN74839.1 chorismate mutase [Lactococcus sp.]